MKLSVIMPIFNEKDTLEPIVEKVLKVPLEKEIIMVDDGSTDGTRDLLEQYRGREDIKIILHSGNRGKGAAIRTAIGHVTGDVVVIQDADLEYDPDDYPSLVRPIVDGETPVVYGSRNLYPGNRRSSFLFYLGGRLLSSITNLLYGQSITDEATCYKAFDAALLKSIPLRCKRFEFCPEITAKVAKRGIRIKEVPIRYAPRSFDQGKKIGLSDGLQAIWTLLKHRFVD